MKKLTSLVLIICFAVVSAIDAKQMNAITAKAELKDMINGSKALLDPTIDTIEKKETAQGLLQGIENLGLTEYAKLLLERKKLANDLDAARAERDTFKTGWLWNSAEWYEADKKVGQINIKLRAKNKEIINMEKQQPKEETYTARSVVTGVVATIGIFAALAALEYHLRPEGYMRSLLGHKTEINAALPKETVQNIPDNLPEWPFKAEIYLLPEGGYEYKTQGKTIIVPKGYKHKTLPDGDIVVVPESSIHEQRLATRRLAQQRKFENEQKAQQQRAQKRVELLERNKYNG
jgi:hypothetical protein